MIHMYVVASNGDSTPEWKEVRGLHISQRPTHGFKLGGMESKGHGSCSFLLNLSHWPFSCFSSDMTERD